MCQVESKCGLRSHMLKAILPSLSFSKNFYETSLGNVIKPSSAKLYTF